MTSPGVTIHTSTRIEVADAPVLTWRAIPEATTACLFKGSGTGWMRSLCRATPFTFRTNEVADDFPRCGDCELLHTGAPGEITEAYGR